MLMRSRLLLGTMLSLIVSGVTVADEWPQFRGGTAQSLVSEATVPAEWSNTEHMAWRTPIPGAGWSQPVVAGGRIFLTTAVGTNADNPSGMGGVMSFSTWGMASTPKDPVQWRVLCLDPADGKILWSKTIVEAVPAFAKHAFERGGRLNGRQVVWIFLCHCVPQRCLTLQALALTTLPLYL